MQLLHDVFEPSFDWKECYTDEFIEQKLNYIHENPCRGKWDLVKQPWEYVHSSARFYFNSEQGVYPVMNYMALKDIDLAGVMVMTEFSAEKRRVPEAGDSAGKNDEDMVYQDAGWIRVGEDAGFEPGNEGAPNSRLHKRLRFSSPVEINQNGYIYIWVSNQSEATKVWFDDLKVTHNQTLVTQATDYGVWGDVLREQKSNENLYRFGYQGQFAEKDEETGWNHFELREYDPVIGRWMVVDPYRQHVSPYVGMSNDPLNRTDADGGYTEGPFGGVLPAITITGERLTPTTAQQTVQKVVSLTDIMNFVMPPIQNIGEMVGISFYEKRGYAVNWLTLYDEFKTGTGPERSLIKDEIPFSEEDDHPMIKDLKNSWIVFLAEQNWAKKGFQPTSYNVPFGLIGAVMSRTMTEQYVGGARVTILPYHNGAMYIIDDTKDRGSYYYHLPFIENYDRINGDKILPESTTYQRYVFFKFFEQ